MTSSEVSRKKNRSLWGQNFKVVFPAEVTRHRVQQLLQVQKSSLGSVRTQKSNDKRACKLPLGLDQISLYRGVPKLELTLELWNRFILTRTPPKVYLFGLDQYINIYLIYVLGIYIPYIYIHDTYIYTVYHYIYIPE